MLIAYHVMDLLQQIANHAKLELSYQDKLVLNHALQVNLEMLLIIDVNHVTLHAKNVQDLNSTTVNNAILLDS